MGRLRCVSRLLVNAVPPGLGGTAGMTAIPIYGECGHEAADSEWVMAVEVV